MIEFERLPDLRDATGVQHHNLVGQGHRFDLVVGHVNHRAAKTLMQTGNLNAHLHAQRGIEVRERFIQQEHARFSHQSTANRHALTLTAGKRFRFALQQMGQLKNFRHLSHALVNQLFFGAGQLQAKRHVFRDGKVGVKRIRLKHHPDTALGGRDIIHSGIANQQIAAGHRFQPGNHTQQGGFAAA